MEVYNENKTKILTDYDLEKGYLKHDTLEHTVPAVKGVEEKGHYETIAEYPNGGKDVKWVVDVVGIKAVEEHIEYEDIQVYVPYTKSELAKIEIEKLKQKLSETDYRAIKYAEGQYTEEDYAPYKAQRQEWRDEINKLEKSIEK
jgi:hypothetical protein